MCKFFVVSGNGQALLGMPHINTLNIININCNTINTHGNDIVNNWSTNTAIHQRYVQHYTNIMQDANRAKKCYADTDSISEFEMKDKLMVPDKECSTKIYILPGPN